MQCTNTRAMLGIILMSTALI